MKYKGRWRGVAEIDEGQVRGEEGSGVELWVDGMVEG